VAERQKEIGRGGRAGRASYKAGGEQFSKTVFQCLCERSFFQKNHVYSIRKAERVAAPEAPIVYKPAHEPNVRAQRTEARHPLLLAPAHLRWPPPRRSAGSSSACATRRRFRSSLCSPALGLKSSKPPLRPQRRPSRARRRAKCRPRASTTPSSPSTRASRYARAWIRSGKTRPVAGRRRCGPTASRRSASAR
jgi:hypothetical protein